MTDTKITGPLSAAEAFLRELCKRHGLRGVTITAYANETSDAFATLVENNDDVTCHVGMGTTVAKALNAANVKRVQWQLETSQLVDEENA